MVSLENLESELTQIFSKTKSTYTLILKNLVTTILIPLIISEVLKSYDDMLVSQETQSIAKDPTAPSKLRPLFEKYLRGLAETGVTVTPEGGIRVQLVSRSVGFPSGPHVKDPDVLKVLFFYIEGMIGGVGFLDKDLYKKFNPKRAKETVFLGRVGEGFLISRFNYSERRRKNPHLDLPPFEEIRHSLSGKGPSDIFSDAMVRVRKQLPAFFKSTTK